MVELIVTREIKTEVAPKKRHPIKYNDSNPKVSRSITEITTKKTTSQNYSMSTLAKRTPLLSRKIDFKIKNALRFLNRRTHHF